MQQLHIHHPDTEHSISTVLTGRVDDQELYLLNDTVSKTQQWTSTTGGIQNGKLERWYRLQYLFWFVLSGLLCVGLTWFTPFGSDESLVSRLLKRFEQAPYWLTALISFGVFLGGSLWLQRGVFGLEGIPAVYHDAMGSYWMMGRSGTWDGFFDAATQYPLGTDYQSLDSYTLWLSSLVLSRMESHELYCVWIVLCPAMSAFSADLLAREWGVKAPMEFDSRTGIWLFWFGTKCLVGRTDLSDIVGWVTNFGTVYSPFSSISSFSWVWWLGSVLSFALCMFTSSYIGASALLLLVGWWIGSKGWKDPRSVYIALGVLPILWIQYQSMSGVGGLGVRDTMKVSIGSLSWDNLLGCLPEMFRERHAIALGLSIVALALAIQFIVGVVRKQMVSKWSPILTMGGVSLLFALGPTWQLDSGSGWTFPLMQWVYGLPGNIIDRVSYSTCSALCVDGGGLKCWASRNWFIVLQWRYCYCPFRCGK